MPGKLIQSYLENAWNYTSPVLWSPYFRAFVTSSTSTSSTALNISGATSDGPVALFSFILPFAVLTSSVVKSSTGPVTTSTSSTYLVVIFLIQ